MSVISQLFTDRGMEALLAAQLINPVDLAKLNAEQLVILKANIFSEIVSNQEILKILKKRTQDVQKHLMAKTAQRG
ncbi:MAG: hypothetical protein PVH61_27485 [Candidatus Aminicenantes bacterium]|jgi:hypothetical protein